MNKRSLYVMGVIALSMLSLTSGVTAAAENHSRGVKRRIAKMSPPSKQGVLDLLHFAQQESKKPKLAWVCAIEPGECLVSEDCLHCNESEASAIPMTREELDNIVTTILESIEIPLDEVDQDTAQAVSRALHPLYRQIEKDQKAINKLYSGLKKKAAAYYAKKDIELEPARQQYLKRYGVKHYRHLQPQAQLNADPDLFHSDYTHKERIAADAEEEAAAHANQQIIDLTNDNSEEEVVEQPRRLGISPIAPHKFRLRS